MSAGAKSNNDASGADAEPTAGGSERISKLLSAHGVASRREADSLIAAGRVLINGEPATIGQKACPGIDEIAVDGAPLYPVSRPVYIMLNKPRGYLTTMNDERGRKTVVSLVTDVSARVYPVGRLDMDSEGLLLMTNDGSFANRVAHPSNNKLKTYEVCVVGDAAGAAYKLRLPMEIDGHVVCAASVELVSGEPGSGVIKIKISEGRNRQIRKMCAGCGLRVLSLKRVSIDRLELGDLRSGHWRYLTKEEAGLFGVES